ncbi:MAG: 7-cyano-7-deazaguanine synthase QueC [Candidatus Hydrogenedentota bacterium]|nr:MAG: 7-cyano-7-deazaguanine synthase QueC [Candidatus Hydrogenedentota bacterium]
MDSAVVLLSGGLDSSTCLYYAKDKHETIYTVAFEYGQRHKIELMASEKISKLAGAKKHFQIPVGLDKIGGSALTDNLEVPKGGKDLDKEDFIPVTYVPARNLVFLSLAAGVAEVTQSSYLYIGANALDYSGYPDCREDFLQAFEKTVQLATKHGREGKKLVIKAPLLHKSKSEIAKLASDLNLPLEYTWSCYDPVKRGNTFFPCGECDSCLLRKRGFEEAGIKDPIWEKGFFAK